MKKLYDEIMALDANDPSNKDYEYGFYCAKYKSAELAKKYDDEIERLNIALQGWIDLDDED